MKVSTNTKMYSVCVRKRYARAHVCARADIYFAGRYTPTGRMYIVAPYIILYHDIILLYKRRTESRVRAQRAFKYRSESDKKFQSAHRRR